MGNNSGRIQTAKIAADAGARIEEARLSKEARIAEAKIAADARIEVAKAEASKEARIAEARIAEAKARIEVARIQAQGEHIHLIYLSYPRPHAS